MSAERGFEFVDTSILVYAFDRSAGEKCGAAQNLIRRLWDSGDGCLSTPVLEELYLVLTHKVSRPLPADKAEGVIRDLSFWRIHTPSAEDLLGAIDFQRQHPLPFRDALVIHSAARLGCTLLWSEDILPGEYYPELQVKNPFQER